MAGPKVSFIWRLHCIAEGNCHTLSPSQFHFVEVLILIPKIVCIINYFMYSLRGCQHPKKSYVVLLL